MYPNEFRYTKDHEWLRTEGDEGVVGITAYAAEELGDIASRLSGDISGV